MRPLRKLGVAAALATMIAAPLATGASAQTKQTLDAGVPTTVADGLILPLGLSVSSDGILVAESGAGLLTKLGEEAPVAVASGADNNAIDGVDWMPDGKALYTESGTSDEGEVVYADLSVVERDGSTRRMIDLNAAEATGNPDRVNSYGFQDLPEGCTVPEGFPGATPYDGIVESHPYGVGYYGYGFSVVADAAANVLWVVDPLGGLFNAVVLPPQPAVITAEMAAANELPECVAGSTYNFEPVPTDVELGPYGFVFVTLLPGGPEDPAAGARGSLIAVSPVTGQIIPIATGLAGATGLAVTPYGVVVNELFANRTSLVIQGGTTLPIQSDIPTPAGVDWSYNRVWVTNDIFPSGENPPDGKVTLYL